VKIQVQIFWVVTPCSVAVGYRRCGGPCCLHLSWRHDITTQKTSTTRGYSKFKIT